MTRRYGLLDHPIWAKCVVDTGNEIQESDELNNETIYKLRDALFEKNPAWDMENMPTLDGYILSNIVLGEVIKSTGVKNQVESLLLQESFNEVDRINDSINSIQLNEKYFT